MKRSALMLVAVLVGLLALAAPAAAQVTSPDSPGEGILGGGGGPTTTIAPDEGILSGGGVATTGAEVSGVAGVSGEALAQTGLNVTVGMVLVVALMALGSAALVASRRRSSVQIS